MWKPGGTLLGVLGKWSGRVLGQGKDPLGRWSWVDLNGKRGRKIKVILAYRVSQSSTRKIGEMTACRQQYRSYIGQGIKDPKPKNIILDDLGKLIHTWRNKARDNHVILMMDSNE